MRFKCLVMDHDDTTVNSTATIHFPSFLAYLKLVRPEASYTLEEYFRKNFDPGIMALFTGELGFSEEEIDVYPFSQDKAIMRAALPENAPVLTAPPEITVLREVTGDPAYKNRQLAKNQRL